MFGIMLQMSYCC